jgi:uncharacterized protein YebE (UPF0316 family)
MNIDLLILKINVFYKNIISIRKFFKNKGKSKLIYFEIPNEIAFSYIDFDVIKSVSILISNLENKDLIELDKFVLDTDIDQWNDDLQDLKLFLKLSWLIEDIRNNGLTSLFQLLQTNNSYSFHPGTTRFLVSTYLVPQKELKGLYVWDKRIDANPFILDYKCKEINGVIELLSLFKITKLPRFMYLNLTDKTDCGDILSSNSPTNRPFLFAQEKFLTILDKFEIPFLTFHDSMHWKKINKKLLPSECIKFNNQECEIKGIKFKKINDIWIKI